MEATKKTDKNTDSITKEVVLNSSIESVWNAISRQEEISTWFLKAEFKAEEGFQYTFTSSDENCTQITGEVKKANPYTLIYTWIVQGTDVETTVEWKLSPTENGTKVNLFHHGISGYEGETAVAMFGSFTGGWENCFNKLAAYL